MDRLKHKVLKQNLRQKRVRSHISGTAARPRLSVNISNYHITAQIIDDSAGKTIAYVTTVGQKAVGGNMIEKAKWVGQEIGKRAKAAKVSQTVFDRGGRLYHGRTKALADAAREQGLEF